MTVALPLKGQCVLITRPVARSVEMTRALTSAGALVLHAPTITIRPMPDYDRVDDALHHIARYDWIVLTSANGVRAMVKRAAALGLNSTHFAASRVAAVGLQTAERLAAIDLKATLVPAVGDGRSLGAALCELGIDGKRILLLRSAQALDALPAMLTAAGAACDDLAIYRIDAPAALPKNIIDMIASNAVHWATFTSPSTFTNFLRLIGPLDRHVVRIQLAAIGPTTARAIRDAGYEPTVTADRPTDSALARAITDVVRRSG